jgi:hypothetical protein
MTTRANLYVDQGTDFAIVLDLFDAEGQDFSISDQIFRCEVRKMYSSYKSFDATLEVIDDTLINNIELVIPASATADKKPGKYQYDLIMFDGLQTTKLLEGVLFLLPTITSSSSSE